MADIGLLNEEDEDFDEDGMELEDMEEDMEEDEEAEQDVEEEEETKKKEEAKSPAALPAWARKKETLTNKFKGKADNLLDKSLTAGQKFYDKNKGKFFKVYDKIMDLKDDMHDARKNAGGGWEGIKSAASVIGKRIQNTDTYRKLANSRFGKGMSFLGNKMKTGAAALKEKAANSKAGQWLAKKKAEREEKKAKQQPKPKKESPGFFSKLWGNIKTGAASLKEKAENSKAGQWLAKKKSEREEKKAKKKLEKKEPGFFGKLWGNIKTGATALKEKVVNSKAGQWTKGKISKGINWYKEQKEWLGKKKEQIRAVKDKISDDFDDHEFERRMNQKARNGDPEYRTRYMKLMEELKSIPGIKDLQGSLSNGDIDNFTKELEAGTEKEEEKESAVSKAGDLLDKAGEKLSISGLSGAGALLKAGGHAKDAFGAAKQSKNLSMAGEKFKSDAILRRSAVYASEESHKQSVTSAFDAFDEISSGASKVLPGVGSTVASAVNFGAGIAKKAVVAKMDKKSKKRGIKELLGGVEGYRKLKEKYRMQSQEMRRAIREVLGVRTEDDIVNTDKMHLSGEVAKRMKEKDESAVELAKTMGANDRKGLYKAMGGSSSVIGRRAYAHQ